MAIASICGGASGGRTNGVGIGDGDADGNGETVGTGVAVIAGDGDAEGAGVTGALCAKAAKGTLAMSAASTNLST